jgi:ketosteroid isomerase-like protein
LLGACLLALVFAAAVTVPREVKAQPGMGGDVARVRTEATIYRAHVQRLLAAMIHDLGAAWDNANPQEPAAFYTPNATITLGPGDVIEGRGAVVKAFTERLGRMHGMRMTMDEFDMSDELAFVRGTMSYELTQAGSPSSHESASFSMLFRIRRDRWLIQSHVIAGPPVLAMPKLPED